MCIVSLIIIHYEEMMNDVRANCIYRWYADSTFANSRTRSRIAGVSPMLNCPPIFTTPRSAFFSSPPQPFEYSAIIVIVETTVEGQDSFFFE